VAVVFITVNFSFSFSLLSGCIEGCVNKSVGSNDLMAGMMCHCRCAINSQKGCSLLPHSLKAFSFIVFHCFPAY